MEPKDLSKELWREYDLPGREQPYRINEPVSLWVGQTTHRVLDKQGVIHCCPAPGVSGCVLRWLARNPADPVQF